MRDRCDRIKMGKQLVRCMRQQPAPSQCRKIIFKRCAVQPQGCLNRINAKRDKPFLKRPTKHDDIAWRRASQKLIGKRWNGPLDNMIRIHSRAKTGHHKRHINNASNPDASNADRINIIIENSTALGFVKKAKNHIICRHHRITTNQQISFMAWQPHHMTIKWLIAGKPDLRGDTTVFLRQASLIDGGSGYAINPRSHNQNTSKRGNTGTANAGDENIANIAAGWGWHWQYYIFWKSWLYKGLCRGWLVAFIGFFDRYKAWTKPVQARHIFIA